MNVPVEQYERAVKSTIIGAFTQFYLNKLPPDEFVLTLNRLFCWKQKQFHHIAVYVKREVEERGHDVQQTLQNISFFAMVLKDYLTRTANQPVEARDGVL